MMVRLHILNPFVFPPQHAVDLVVAVVSSSIDELLVSPCFSNNTDAFLDKSPNIGVILCILFIFPLYALTSSVPLYFFLRIGTAWLLHAANFPVVGQWRLILSSKLNVRTDATGLSSRSYSCYRGIGRCLRSLAMGSITFRRLFFSTRLSNFLFQSWRVKQSKQVNNN